MLTLELFAILFGVVLTLIESSGKKIPFANLFQTIFRMFLKYSSK